ncbi:ABC-2 type transport system ATP-binding protein [Paenibacillus uliginis N3/975]|uniref:ABC-2 type transport system ATP-binding protein n=1 Tax=Paenibacillus uliginis N3/975 TaxID=1313296 RepID=A0A1X7G7L3_9BACL|nr:ABC transporter ATP-binding protein [Paenibacillus uliginis]SMF65260.1 ABC-2 type transport system ATP-binding protein [Paenibacillus uliginis N3/975]
MKTLIQAHGLVKTYGHKHVVNGIHLDIREGEVLAIIGPNGAGKSTTLDLILGLRRPDDGSVTYWTSQPSRHIGLQLQSTPFFPGFTALENLRMFAAFYGLRLKDHQLMPHLERCGLADAAKTDALRLSGGQQKRLAIAMALVHDPNLLFLDEPTASLDPRARREIRELIRSLADAGTSIVFTSHDMEEVNKLAQRILLICNGKIQAEGSPEFLLSTHGAESLEELYISLTEA